MTRAIENDPDDPIYCRVCGVEIYSCELCEKCAEGNDPFFTSKYSDDARGK